MGPIDSDLEHAKMNREWDEDWKNYFYCLDYSKDLTVTP